MTRPAPVQRVSTAGTNPTSEARLGPPRGDESSSDRETRLSELIEMIEERVLIQLERRGGRYHGVF